MPSDHSSRRVKCSLFILVGIVLLYPLQGQIVKSTILGTVRDSSGAVIPGASVSVKNVETNITRTAVTSDRGEFVVDLLEAGTYRVEAEMSGFKRGVEPEAVLDSATRLRVDLTLEVGQPGEEVEVRASTPLVDTETTTFAQTLKQEQIQELPVLSRNYQVLSQLMPTAVTPIGTFLNDFFGNESQGVQPQIGGQRGAAVNYTLDGIGTNGALFQEQSLIPSMESIQEVRVQSHNFQAEHGRGGVQFTVTTKSGTNEFHGSVWNFHQNTALNANTFFNNRIVAPSPNPTGVGEKQHFIRNQFGGSVGGPIVRNRTFFFFSYEGIRLRRSSNVAARAVESQWLQGNFSDVTTPIIDPVTGTPFPDNMIPAHRIHPTAQAALPFFITRNITDASTLASLPAGQNHVGNVQTVSDPNFWTVRIDHKLTDSDSIHGRYMQNLETLKSSGLAPLAGRLSENQGRNAMLSETHVFSPRVINELRLGYNRGRQSTLQEGSNGNCFEPCEPINYVEDVFKIQNTGGGPITWGLPNFTPVGFAGIGGPGDAPSAALTNTWQLSDNLIMNYGSHSLKTGFDLRGERLNARFGTFSRGLFNFTGQFSGHSMADLLLGIAGVAGSARGEAEGIMHSNSYQFYFQDDWRVSPKLTLNLGLRYEYYEPWSEENGKLSRFQHGAVLGTCFEETDFCPPGRIITPGPGESITKPDKLNLAPRVGFAYAPFGDSSTVIRAAYGIFYSPLEAVEAIFNLNTPPNVVRFTVFPETPSDLESTSLDNLFPPSDFDPTRPLVTGPDWPLAGRVNIFTPSEDFKEFTLQHWQLTFQRELVRNLMLELGYVGTHGYNGQRVISGNQARLDDCGFSGGCTPEEVTPLTSRSPYRQLNNWMRFAEKTAHNSYHAGTVKVERRFEQGFSFLSSYTFSRTIDAFGNLNDPLSFHNQNTYDKDGDKSLSSFHAKHRFTTGYIWELPFGKGHRWGSGWNSALDAVAGGWQVSGITTFQTGNPVRIGVTRDWANVGTFAFTQRPDTGAPLQSFNPRSDDLRYFNEDAFVNPELGTFGDSGRGVFTGPGINNWDIAVSKNFHVREDQRLQFRAEFFNALNHAQFQGLGSTVGLPGFGQVISTRAPRNIQVALRYDF